MRVNLSTEPDGAMLTGHPDLLFPRYDPPRNTRRSIIILHPHLRMRSHIRNSISLKHIRRQNSKDPDSIHRDNHATERRGLSRGSGESVCADERH